MADSPEFSPDQKVYAQTHINLRSSPGYLGKTAADLLLRVKPGTVLRIIQGPESRDNLLWWQVSAPKNDGEEEVEGWVAAATARGRRLIDAEAPAPQVQPIPPAGPPAFRRGESVQRVAAGSIPIYVEDLASGQLQPHPQYTLPSAGPFSIIGGPLLQDELTWWQLRCPLPNGEVLTGWVPESTARGMRVLIPDTIPTPITIHKPFQGRFALSQGFAANPDFYQQFTYAGVPLRGHNGLDFAMPTGTRILAADKGVVVKLGEDRQGFGLFVLLRHTWGQTLYAHLRFVTVQYQQEVQAQQVIGLSGNSGASTGPHLHFGLRLLPFRRDDGWGGYCDPTPFLSASDLVQYRGEGWHPAPPGPEDPKLPRP